MNAEDPKGRMSTLELVEETPKEAKDKVLQLFLDVGAQERFLDGQMLIRQDGLGGDTGFILTDGTVHIEAGTADPIPVHAPALLGEMHQLNPYGQRTASVTARGTVAALNFSWMGLYAHAKEVLSPLEQNFLYEGIERVVLKRFHRETLMDLPPLRALPERIRLRVCLMVQWIAKRHPVADGETIFEERSMCGDVGRLLTRGEVVLTAAGVPVATMTAPDLLGILPNFDAALRWSATAEAKGDTEVLNFSWLALMKLLAQRMPPEAYDMVRNALADYAKDHFAQ